MSLVSGYPAPAPSQSYLSGYQVDGFYSQTAPSNANQPSYGRYQWPGANGGYYHAGTVPEVHLDPTPCSIPPWISNPGSGYSLSASPPDTGSCSVFSQTVFQDPGGAYDVYTRGLHYPQTHPQTGSQLEMGHDPRLYEIVTSGGVKVVKRRVSANKKERRRTISINTAFSSLRGCIPNVPSDTKLSKIKTLRLATSYIAYLMDILQTDDPQLTGEDFKADLSRKSESKEDRKRKEAEEMLRMIHKTERKSKGRTGWPQAVWASELHPESASARVHPSNTVSSSSPTTPSGSTPPAPLTAPHTVVTASPPCAFMTSSDGVSTPRSTHTPGSSGAASCCENE